MRPALPALPAPRRDWLLAPLRRVAVAGAGLILAALLPGGADAGGPVSPPAPTLPGYHPPAPAAPAPNPVLTNNRGVTLIQLNNAAQQPSAVLQAARADGVQGQVYVINRNGVIFGGPGQVNTNALTAASTQEASREVMSRLEREQRARARQRQASRIGVEVLGYGGEENKPAAPGRVAPASPAVPAGRAAAAGRTGVGPAASPVPAGSPATITGSTAAPAAGRAARAAPRVPAP